MEKETPSNVFGGFKGDMLEMVRNKINNRDSNTLLIFIQKQDETMPSVTVRLFTDPAADPIVINNFDTNAPADGASDSNENGVDDTDNSSSNDEGNSDDDAANNETESSRVEEINDTLPVILSGEVPSDALPKGKKKRSIKSKEKRAKRVKKEENNADH